jgi:hypothetical protein
VAQDVDEFQVGLLGEDEVISEWATDDRTLLITVALNNNLLRDARNDQTPASRD